MRLISAHIENFGKLHDYDVDFDNNPYVFLENNGWGKTTLATFIKVMLYGFDGERKQSLSENERKMYMPWNKGNFGGTIVFEVNGKEYSLTREFGKKSLEDSAQLKENITKIVSDDYNTETIGEQIFGIDSDSFKRTIFISKNDMESDNKELGGSIQAKIGNLTDATDDVNNYDNVMKNIKGRLSDLKSGYKKGAINKLNEKAQELNAELLSLSSVNTSLDEVSEKYRSEQKRLEDTKEQIKKLDKLMKESAYAGEYAVMKKSYLDSVKEAEELKDKIKEYKSYFEYEIPDDSELEKMLDTARGLARLSSDMDNNKPEKGEDLSTSLPTSEKIDSMLESWGKYKDCMSKINSYETRIEGAQQVAEVKKTVAKNQYESDKRDIEHRYDDKFGAVRRNYIVLLAVGIIFLLATLPLYSFTGIGGLIACGVVAVSLMAGAFVYRSKTMSKLKESMELSLAELEKGDEQYSEPGDIKRLRDEKKSLEDEAHKIRSNTQEFFNLYGMNFYDEVVERELFGIKEKVKNRDNIEAKLQRYENAKGEYEKKRKVCEEYLLRVSGEVKGDIVASLSEIKQALMMYKEDSRKLKEKERYCEEFWTDKPYDMEHAPIETECSTEEIIQKKETLNEEIEKCNEIIKSYIAQIDNLTHRKDRKDEAESELEEIRTSLEQYKTEYDIIELVSEHLKKAKVQLTATYLEPISDAFVKYYGFIYEDDLDSYEIDANINITKIEEGANRSLESLSAGYRDLTLVALRMALVDSMYKDEKPFIIMDDPFVNLDTKKVKAAKQFLQEVARDYQVLYFTCHESRM